MTDSASSTATPVSSIDPDEVARFSALAAEWWDPKGKFGVLHKFNPVRLAYIREKLCAHFGLDEKLAHPFQGLRILDIGCGGGLICEPMARLGATIVGVDASEKNINTASVHAQEQGLTIDYRATTAEALLAEGETFDVVLNMEVVEHVADVDSFVADCAAMVKPGGLMVIATINRTAKAFFMAIIGAERLLRWLPVGTHQYEKLVKPEELASALAPTGMAIIDKAGVTFNPLEDRWKRVPNDLDVNYIVLAARPKA
ncbi:MAG: bifunctional 2-polyprenyl-6-hydroxyphenol methylase/3-demethylubiquinol 3-O-methyltransferase UbiG [Rhizobiales bacterium]|nr:bifunctional 2-polyprenyl-6-hydroxyphenol methylase/3-demethylubiquinol 3-O-methyltransferase UbiG [Hyphomicrobiales bacterium]MBO6699886.1 bifunctional 2-polyprenyl-6-hydroxyphenol methylase/3-demethylubiquinol 3-O-methyltransferase UbiG [Hyphomicrobiales bacterium]MBO6737424.1 bifunctional 2-polyprenyl-6-hydroxyphenol methylase/3-demethylubiquinol 3-O-methyltransferase UbiG [Hyphomicrobiales bacterium]MBO6911502.1 bifunctional 2-polyprenyl-6-hydroxyphenol methylase/3-demethylubiquinol 3-O-m